jgi:DeoR family fructose operon transcriptional repressor
MTKADLRAMKLLESLQLNKRLDVRTVAEDLNISEATVRRLFAKLEEEGKVIRVHGGVQLAPKLGFDYSYRVSALHRKREKTIIGNAVVKVIQNNERLFIDSGTTALKLAEALSLKIQAGELKDIVVLTNSLTNIDTLANWCKVILIGGEIRIERRDVCGAIAEKNLTLFHVNRAFFGADAISLKGGFMTTDERTSKMNEIIMAHSEHIYVLADSEKFDRSSFITYSGIQDVTAIYTDSGIDKGVLDKYLNAGAKIEIVHG